MFKFTFNITVEKIMALGMSIKICIWCEMFTKPQFKQNINYRVQLLHESFPRICLSQNPFSNVPEFHIANQR